MATYVPGTLESDPKKIVMSLQQIGPKVDTLTTKTTGYESAWSTYSPTCTSSSGTITSVSATGRYLIIGKTVFLSVTVVITTAGTGAGILYVPLPVAAKASNNQPLTGSESALTGQALSTYITAADPTRAYVVFFNATTVIGNGAVANIGGVYEAA